MRIHTLIFLFSLISSIICILNAQKISGNIIDENKNPVEYASIILLNAKDSTMLEFTNSNRKGEFLFENKNIENKLLQLSYLGYETTYFKIEASGKDILLENIVLKPNTTDLDAIEIKDYVSPMTFGRDTIQYNAAAFKIKPGDMAEDLLRKLPGLEVQRDGTVKALGENVQNVFVDGKEFFGKDTKIATKNLDADAIDKVQVFDKKSDRSEFTGIEDGQKERSINLKLKADKKIGYFGTVEGAGGSHNSFKGRANINRFSTNLRSSFIGMANNINEQNFSINDYIDFMGGMGALMSSGGGGRFTLDLDQNSGLPLGLLNNEGIQRSFAGGVNFNKSFSSKTSLDFSVFGNQFNNNLLRKTTRENLLPESRYITMSDDAGISDNNAGSFTARLKTRIDSTQNLTIKINGSLGRSGNNSIEKSNVFDLAQVRQNDTQNKYLMAGNNFKMASDILWQKKSSKHGRNYSFNSILNFSNIQSNNNLNTEYNIYFPTLQFQSILQDQIGLDDGFYYKLEGSYTEPIGKKRYLEFRSSLANQENKTSTDYFDIVNDNPIRNIILSNLYQRDYTQYQGGINVTQSREKYNFTFGAKYEYAALNGIINEENNKVANTFGAILPNAFLTYRFGMSEHLDFNYSSSLNEPSLRQLQPIVNNNNPLEIYRGNPGLKAEQMHNANLSYMKYDAFNFTMLYANLQTNYVHNKIIESLTIDNSFVRSYQPINTKNESTTTARLEYDTPIRSLKLKVRTVLRASYNKGISIINSQSNPYNRKVYSYNFSLENRNKDIFDLLVGFKSNQSNSKFTQNQDLNQSYNENTIYAELGINVKDIISIKSNFDYLSITPSFSNVKTTIPLWTVSISSYITKDKKLRATVSCFDILNKNLGIRTSSQLNFTEINRTNVLGRYLMFGLAYSIKGFQKKSDLTIDLGRKD